MVQNEGIENGIGIYDINKIDNIEEKIKQQISTFDFDFEIESIYVMGSFGSGMGIPGESDLDIIVSGNFQHSKSPNKSQNLRSKLEEHIETSQIISNFPQFTELDLYVHNPSRSRQELELYAEEEPSVTHYYNLTTNSKVNY